MFFQKMAICEYQILAIFGQFWPSRAHFGPWVSKVYLLQLFRCKKNNEITKSGSISLFGKLDPSGAPKPTLGPKTPLKGPGRAKIGVNAPHVVQLTGFGPKKPNLNRSVQRCVPFTRNQPYVWVISLSRSTNPCSTWWTFYDVPPIMWKYGSLHNGRLGSVLHWVLCANHRFGGGAQYLRFTGAHNICPPYHLLAWRPIHACIQYLHNMYT